MVRYLKAIILFLVLPAFAVASVVACGEPNRPSENSSPSGGWVAGTTLVSELDDEQAANVCGEIDDQAEDQWTGQGRCVIDMIVSTDFQSDPAQYCSDNWNDCVNRQGDFAEVEEPNRLVDCSLDEINRSDCDATVDEIRACHDEVNGVRDSLAGAFECSAFEQEEPPSGLEDSVKLLTQEGPECASVPQACKQLGI